MRILICEFMDERAVNRLRSAHDVHYDAALVDDAPALLHEGARADVRAMLQKAVVQVGHRCEGKKNPAARQGPSSYCIAG